MKYSIQSDKWLPTSVQQIKSSLIFKCNDVLKSNIAYNFQYLEYIIHLNELEKKRDDYPTSVIMKYKSFVITSMGIIESIFISLAEEHKILPYDFSKHNRTEKIINNKDTLITYIRRKKKKFKRINFDELLLLVENNNLLTLESNEYVMLSDLKTLRNKVHLEKASIYLESDYNSFDHNIFNTTKLLLYKILKNDNITSYKYNFYLETLVIS